MDSYKLLQLNVDGKGVDLAVSVSVDQKRLPHHQDPEKGKEKKKGQARIQFPLRRGLRIMPTQPHL